MTHWFLREPVNFNKHKPKAVSMNVASPQGDAISECFFNIELEGALRLVREGKLLQTTIMHPYAVITSFPTDMQFADTNFISEN